jgi:hypothetical protein
MFDCWVQLMQQQLLRPSTGLLLQAAHSRSLPAAATSGQQLQQQVDKMQTLQRCSCATAWVPECDMGSSRSLSTGSISLSCTQQQVVAVLLVLLGRMKDRTTQAYTTSSSSGVRVMDSQMWRLWSSQAPAVMLTAEALLRRILPATVLCDALKEAGSSHDSGQPASSSRDRTSNGNSSGSGGISSSSSVCCQSSSAAGMLRESLLACLKKKRYNGRLEWTLLSVISDPTPGGLMRPGHSGKHGFC